MQGLQISLFYLVLVGSLVGLLKEADGAPTNQGPSEVEVNAGQNDVLDMPAGPQSRSLIEDSKLWPNGVIYYDIDASLTSEEGSIIQKAVGAIMNQSCLLFVKCPCCPDRLTIGKSYTTALAGCVSQTLGKRGGVQWVNLATGCWFHGIVIHELLHAAGFYHEQTRPDRDQHLIINYDNIKPDRDSRNQYEIYTGRPQTIGKFDFGSIMMYKTTSASTAVDPKKPVMTPKYDVENNSKKMGQRDGLSSEDIWKINNAYCNSTVRSTVTPSKSCNGVRYHYAIGTEKILNSPGFPENYLQRSDCTWFMWAPPGHVVKAEIFGVNLCSNDTLYLTDSSVNKTHIIIAKSQGCVKPGTVYKTVRNAHDGPVFQRQRALLWSIMEHQIHPRSTGDWQGRISDGRKSSSKVNRLRMIANNLR